MAQLTFNAATGTGHTVIDGNVWSSMQTSDADSADTSEIQVRCQKDASGYDLNMYRGHITFDTSSLPDNAIVSLVELKLYPTQKGQTGMSNYGFRIVGPTTQASGTDLVVGDHPNSKFSTTDLSGLQDPDINAYTTITLNNNNVVSTTGYTKLGIMSSRDYTNTQPEDVGDEDKIRFDSYGGPNAPQLVVTYTVPAVSSGGYSFFM